MAGWPEGGPPSAEGLQLVARAVVFSRWIAGVHREGRDGFAVGNDCNEILGHFLAACDMTAVILEPF